MTPKQTPQGAHSPVSTTFVEKTKAADLGWQNFFRHLAAEKTSETRQALPRHVQE